MLRKLQLKPTNYLLVVLLSIAVSGCSTNYADESDEGKPTMLERHEDHVNNLYGNKVDMARIKFANEDNELRKDNRYSFNSELRLPNPELEMVVFPRQNKDGSVQPEYKLKFGMYGKVHYVAGKVQ